MPQTWYTQPKNGGFSSFYFFDAASRHFVRVRLELNRPPGASGDDGLPKIMFRANRYVGFSPVRIDPGTIQLAGGILEGPRGPLVSDPAAGLMVYDGSAASPTGPFANTPHMGNPVTTSPILPPGITEAMLIRAVDKIMGSSPAGTTINLSANNSSEADLVLGIEHYITT
jgi:hypothetical protein